MTTAATDTKAPTGTTEAASSAASAASATAATDAAAAAAAAAGDTKAGDTKAGDAAPPAGTTKVEPAAATVVPETYDLKLPDGSTFDADFVKRTADNARALGLSNEAGQKLLDAQIAEITKATTAAADRVRTEAMQSLQKDWTPDTGPKWLEQDDAHKKAALADKEIGGSPEKLAASIELSGTVLRRFATPALVDRMRAGGFASDPEVVRFLARIGNQMAEGTLKLPGPRSEKLTEEEKLARRYPKHAEQLAKANT